jgi:ferredoxin
MFTISIGNTGQKIAGAPDRTILDAAVAAGIDYPYACASGNCGQCVSRLTEGTVDMLPRGDASLSPAQVAAGQILACRAQPRSNVVINWLGRGGR